MGLFLIYFQSLHYITILQQYNVNKCPSSSWCWDSNPRSLECESPPKTTTPGLPSKPVLDLVDVSRWSKVICKSVSIHSTGYVLQTSCVCQLSRYLKKPLCACQKGIVSATLVHIYFSLSASISSTFRTFLSFFCISNLWYIVCSINLSLYLFIILSLYHSLSLSFCNHIILLLYHSIALSFYCSIILFLYHSIAISFYCSIILLLYHSISLSFYCSIILLLYHSNIDLCIYAWLYVFAFCFKSSSLSTILLPFNFSLYLSPISTILGKSKFILAKVVNDDDDDDAIGNDWERVNTHTMFRWSVEVNKWSARNKHLTRK